MDEIMTSKKAQAWGFDLLIALIIFTLGIIAFYLYALNMPNEAESIMETMNYQGNAISNSILSEGYPLNWNQDDVTNIGILSNNKINQTKLERFFSLSSANYVRSKSLFNTRYEYYVSLSENFTINGSEVEGIGNKPTSPKNLIKIARLTIYNNKPIIFNLEVWE